MPARASIERGRYWHAEYWISPSGLPADVLEGFDDALVRSLERDELLRALAGAVEGLLRESEEVRQMGPDRPQAGGRTPENLAQATSPFRPSSSRRSSIRRGSRGAPPPSVTAQSTR
jgi:hypothetical protein